MKTIEYVRIAFRKLKAEVYFNKTVLHLRDKVVAYEASEKFDYNLNNIAEAYDKMMLGEESPLMSEILASINIMYYPKKMKSFELNDNTVISVGNPKEEPVISELQYFIDMDVNGHILGILWIMKFGKRLEEVCFDNARGNRLRNNLIWNEEGEILESPALFEPYFAQYSLWRDKGLSCAESLLAQKQDALIVTLDLKKFYYRTGINESVFNTILEPDEKDTDITLHKTIFMILRRYTEILDLESVDHSGIALPIGFLPSAVLSNWCLEKFDKGILDFWNPAYYGRYVDDVIIIEKIEKGSEIYKKARENVLTKDDVIDYYLGEGRRRNTAYFALKTNENSSSFVESKNRICVTNEKIDNDSLYKVNEEFCLSDKSLYEFQIIKTRIIALFAENNSTALLNKFKKEIYTNVRTIPAL